jgi:hypothetical protein
MYGRSEDAVINVGVASDICFSLALKAGLNFMLTEKFWDVPRRKKCGAKNYQSLTVRNLINHPIVYQSGVI